MSRSSSDDGVVIGVRRFKLDTRDSSSDIDSNIDSDGDRGRKAALSKSKPMASELNKKSGGPARTHRPRGNSSSSLELSTSSSRSSSSSGAFALPAAFRKAVAATAAVRQQRQRQDEGSSGAEGGATSRLGTQMHRTAAAAAAAPLPTSERAEQETRLSATDVPPAAAAPADASAASSAVVTGAGASSTSSAASPTLRSGADFVFQRRHSSPPRNAAAVPPQSSAPAALSKFAPLASGGDSSSSSSNNNSSSRRRGERKPSLTVPLATSTTERVRLTTSERQQGTLSFSAASPTASATDRPMRTGTANTATTTTTDASRATQQEQQPAPVSGPHTSVTVTAFTGSAAPLPTTITTMKRFSVAVRLCSSSSSSSSAASTPRLAAAAVQRREERTMSPLLSSSDSLIPTAVPKPTVAAPRMSTPPPASAAPPPKAVAPLIGQFAAMVDSDEDEAVGSSPPQSLRAPAAAAAAVATAPATALPAVPEAAMSHKDTAALRGAPVSQEPSDPSAAARASAPIAQGASSPTPSVPASTIAYNRVSARGIGSVPASVIEAPSRPKRRALPSEHTMTGAAAAAVAAVTTASPSSFNPAAPVAAPPSVRPPVDNLVSAKGQGKVESSNPGQSFSPTAAAAAASPSSASTASPDAVGQPLRHAPQMPDHVPAPPPPTLLEDESRDGVSTAASGQRPPPPPPDALGGGGSASSFTPSLSTTYQSRSAAAATSQLQREAELVIYDDRVPPAWRTGRRAQTLGSVPAPALASNVVAAWMILGEPHDPARSTVAYSSFDETQVWKREQSTQRLQARLPVLHAGEGPRARQRRVHPDVALPQWCGLQADEGVDGDAHVVVAGEARTRSHHRRSSSRSHSRRRAADQASTASAQRGSKSLVSDAVLQQLIQQPGEATRQGNERIRFGPRQEDASVARKGAQKKSLSSSERRQRVSDIGVVDLLHYRSSRGS